MNQRIRAAVLGATGAVGQRFVQLLDNHPWFEVVALTGSDRAVGRPYAQACHWILPQPMPAWARDLVVQPTDPQAIDAPLVFSALPARVAHHAEPAFAAAGRAVCSNASAFRDEPDVPLLLPEVNPGHTGLIHRQQQARGWQGFIVTNPNCTSTGITITLKALQDAFGVRQVFAVSLQALSGAGYPGVASLDILNNVIPYIPGEEDKVESEPCKMLGTLRDGAIAPAGLAISAHTNRVAVADGHTVCLSLALERPPAALADVRRALAQFTAPPQSRDLRSDPLLDYKMVVLSHNTIRGAAGASIYNAELLLNQGFIKGA